MKHTPGSSDAFCSTLSDLRAGSIISLPALLQVWTLKTLLRMFTTTPRQCVNRAVLLLQIGPFNSMPLLSVLLLICFSVPGIIKGRMHSRQVLYKLSHVSICSLFQWLCGRHLYSYLFIKFVFRQFHTWMYTVHADHSPPPPHKSFKFIIIHFVL